jgi:hypothetical protein
MTWAEETVNLYHFRDKRKNEVDIVLEQSDVKLVLIHLSVLFQDF